MLPNRDYSVGREKVLVPSEQESTGGTGSLYQECLTETIKSVWQIVREGIKSGNVSETCGRHGVASNLYYRWQDEAEQGAKAALGRRSAAARRVNLFGPAPLRRREKRFRGVWQ